MKTPAVFISYRRDDCPGYAGRLEDALERIYGKGSAFRDVRDIDAGADFTDVIESCLHGVRASLVLIGPQWLGVHADGTRRIDDPKDFVRLEVATALASASKVVPVLLAGASLPHATELPEDLRALTSRQALSLSETNWDAELQRLVKSLGIATLQRKRAIAVAIGLAFIAAATGAAYMLKPMAPATDPAATLSANTADKLIGTWEGTVKYYWGDSYKERFVFKRFAGDVTGTASFLEYPRGIEDFVLKGGNLSFVTHTVETVNAQDRQLTHRYQAELDGTTLHMRMQTTGGFTSVQPQEFTAQRVAETIP
jgi:hypothetical protein